MAQSVITNNQVIVGSFNLSGFADTANADTYTITTADVTTFGNNDYRTLIPGIKLFAVGIQGFSDFAATGTAPAFPASALGTQYAYSINPNGSSGSSAAGDVSIFGRGILSAYTPFGGAVGAAARFSQVITADTTEANGVLLAPLVSRGAYTGPSVTLAGPTATQRITACLHVTGAVGTNLAVTIESAPASNFASPTTRFTFSTVSAVGWQFPAPVVGAITDGFWRAKATVGSSTFTWSCSVGVINLPY